MIERGFAVLRQVHIGKPKLPKVVEYDGADSGGVFNDKNRDLMYSCHSPDLDPM